MKEARDNRAERLAGGRAADLDGSVVCFAGVLVLQLGAGEHNAELVGRISQVPRARPSLDKVKQRPRRIHKQLQIQQSLW